MLIYAQKGEQQVLTVQHFFFALMSFYGGSMYPPRYTLCYRYLVRSFRWFSAPNSTVALGLRRIAAEEFPMLALLVCLDSGAIGFYYSD